jgi:hypothetical protein
VLAGVLVFSGGVSEAAIRTKDFLDLCANGTVQQI